MKQSRSLKQRFIASVLVLVMLFTSLIGSTFAWFTDSASSDGNTIQTGNLKVDLLHKTGDDWVSVKDNPDHKVFDYDKWEPGYTRVETLKVANLGSLALKYKLSVEALDGTAVTGANGENLADVIEVYITYSETNESSYSDITSSDKWVRKGTLTEVLKAPASFITGNLFPSGQYVDGSYGAVTGVGNQIVKIALHMKEDAGNEYQKLSIGDVSVNIVATQWTYENDSFGSDYDKDSVFPELNISGITVDVQTANGVVTNPATISGEGVSGIIPAGVAVDSGVNKLGLSVTEKAESDANLTLNDGEALRSLDVHMYGVSKNNTVPMLITVEQAMKPGLNIGNYTLYHLENGVTVAMTAVNTAADLDAHNEFYYDPATGDVTLAMATFSEVAMVAEPAKWEGTRDYSWYDASKTELTIANADQLAAFGAIVGGMADGIDQDNFAGKTVKLIADIDLGDKDDASTHLFYPIGYYNDAKSYTKPTDGTATAANVTSFQGTFDGNGHTISNFYQNTWQMWGNYDGNYYKAAMGLFGYVYGGTVQNLTVSDFSSDGEYTPTGVIAAYAAGNATFENIAITNCNPRVYNTGNGGIIGIAGDTSAANDDHVTLKNITVDNSNKISALWGSWDVACGGLVGMYRGNVDGSGNATGDTISFENCHVSAQIDVYNDVCANYQYYAYRYSGMIIGSVRHNTTSEEGRSIPNMTGISASGCTVHFGTWNDYYYCELVDNTTASYTHDYQMSRLVEIKAIEGTTITYLDGSTGTVPASGRANYVIVDYSKGHGTENATCYHFNNGEVWTHDMGGIQTGIDENGDGQDDLREDKQHLYLEFNNLFTGYGWGVSSMGIDKWNGIEKLDVTAGEHEKSVEKFEGKVHELANNKTYKLGDLFKFVNNGVDLVPGALTVSIVNKAENNPVSATIDYDRENWADGTITLTGTGEITITIQDYYFCTPTTIDVTITDRQPEEKFDVVMNNGDFLHRVGNVGTVAIDKLFKAKDGVTVGTISVTVEAVNGTSASGTYSNNAIQFNGTGVVKVTITDNDYCIPTELYLEVVDATNVTGATSATNNNVVLLNDCGFSSLEVSGGYTLYGNGFTMTCGSDSAALDMGYAFVKLENGTLDNVQIVCPNFDYAVLYKKNMTESGNRSETTDKTRYFNVKSGVMVSGNSQILNSRISGARAAVNVTSGNCLIDNSRLEGGAVASLLVGAANSLTLRDITLVQKPTASTYDSSKVLMGFSVLVICDANGDAAPITLEGTLVQDAWVTSADNKYVPSSGQSIVTNALKQTNYLHDIDGDGKNESLNLGFAYMPDENSSKVNVTTITDNRTNKNTVPYQNAEISVTIGVTTCVYSYTNSNGTIDDFKNVSEYKPNKYGDIITVNYSDTNENRVLGKVFGNEGWVYQLSVDLDQGAYTFDFSKLTVLKNSVSLAIDRLDTVNVEEGTTEYNLTLEDGSTLKFKLIGTATTKEAPQWSNDANGSSLSSSMNASWEAGLCVASSKGGTWSGAAPALQNVYIRYYSTEAKAYKVINLADYTPNVTGKVNGSNTTCTINGPDFTLTLTGGQVHSSNKVSAIPVVCDGKLYFVAATSSGLVNSGNSARSVPVSYSFTDGFGNTLTGSHSWSVAEDQNNEYKYSDFCNGTLTKLTSGGSSPCVTPDTLVTLADGTQKRIDEVTYEDQLLVWDFFTGKYAVAPAAIIFNHGYDNNTIIKLNFSDGTVVKVANIHQFYDNDLNKFVTIDAESVAEYVGHNFAKQSGDGYTTVTLDSYEVSEEYEAAYGIISAFHYNIIVEGMISTDFMIEDYDLFNYFVFGEGMTFDEDQMQADIEKYGLYTYEDFADYLTYEQFVGFNVQYFKIAVGKGNYTYEGILDLIDTYLNN